MSTLDLRKMMEERKRYMHQPLNNGLNIPTNRYFNYDQESLRGKFIPGFAKIILDHPYFSQEQKQKFVDLFLIEYLEDEEIQEALYGQYLIFNNRDFIAILEDLKELSELEKQGYTGVKYTVPIGYVRMTGGTGGFSVSFDRPPPHEKLSNFHDGPRVIYEEGPYIVNVGISAERNPSSFDQFIEREMIYDTGAFKTIIPFPELYDADKQEFFLPDNYPYLTEENINFYTKESYERERIVTLDFINKLNDNRDHFEPLQSHGVTSSADMDELCFKVPIKVTPGGLTAKELMSVAVPKENNILRMLLLGRDLINQYTNIISRFNGKIQLRITEQRDEI